jgi:C4-dicarboxylate transporter DctM subunit
LAIVTVVVACFFAAISGSGPATVAAIGTILYPAMTKAGYEKGFAAALLANAGNIGIVILDNMV